MVKRFCERMCGLFGGPYDEKFPFEIPETIRLTEINTMTENEWKCCVEAALKLTENMGQYPSRTDAFMSALRQMISIRTSAVLMMSGDYKKADKPEDKPA